MDKYKTNFILSKSTFLMGVQCSKRLFLHKHFKKLKDPFSPMQQAIFSQGHKIGILAQALFPGGIDASPTTPFDYEESLKKTKELIQSNTKVIYEAYFKHDGVLIALDVLVKKGNLWLAYEVKSATSVSQTHILDAALQYHTISGSGLKLSDVCIVTINNQYQRDQTLDLSQLFNIQSVYDGVLELQGEVDIQISALKKVILQKTIPKKDIGEHCFQPYTCDFMGHCWKHMPKNSIFELTGLQRDKKWEYLQNGIFSIKDITDLNAFNFKQQLQINGVKKSVGNIDIPNINAFLSELEYPLYFLDFESFQTAVPPYPNSKPYQQIVFQYSLHIKNTAHEELLHLEFLASQSDKDPRLAFIEHLIGDVGKKGSVVVYNKAFEKKRLQEIAHYFPQYKPQCENIISRMLDLMIPFQKGWYYTPKMNGSHSIKSVLPALVPELSYANLGIKEGGMASLKYLELRQNDTQEVEKIKSDLLAYCKLDTLAMVKIVEKLQAETSGKFF